MEWAVTQNYLQAPTIQKTLDHATQHTVPLSPFFGKVGQHTDIDTNHQGLSPVTRTIKEFV